ncbi:isochorismate synthase [Halonotius pteroides]|uniref:isochorismate synthase n=1 Tax=Halonotius pteroides TaxID=268735 RepID=A0A3A6QR52_9EURY|nr:isochorismate synthase [Halonotius pteroides]RJX50737.1 isochorismate synthase [Halonotius pteroides]
MESPRAADRPRLVSRSIPLADSVPSFRALVDEMEPPRTVWNAADEARVVAGGAAATLTADGPDRFRQIRTAAERLFEAGDVHAGTEAACPRLFGGFAFHSDGAAASETTDNGDHTSPWAEFPDARFVFPRVQVTQTEGGPWLTVNAVGPSATPAAVEAKLDDERERLLSRAATATAAPRPGITDRRRTTTPTGWRTAVRNAVERIDAGTLRKVVLAQALEADLGGNLAVPDILDRLSEKYPDCTRFLIEPDSEPPAAFFGATPERLVSLRGRTVETGALAGTTGRGETPAEDEWLAEELLADEKNVHEHELVAETIREQLAPFAASVSVGERGIKRLATVQHLHTPITAELTEDTHVLDVVEALHPTPAVGGLPPDRALETIRETEPFDRGWYAAPVGWIDAAGNGTFAVGLRSAVATQRRATLFAGVGIVDDSDPDAEWDEVELKFRPILDELEA